MPGQIKIDDGSGNYTILTNAGSLGSDKTITIPNTTGTMALTSDSFGKVLQYVVATNAAVQSTTSTSYADITNLTADITPSATSSKIHIIFNDNFWINRSSTSLGGKYIINKGGSDITATEQEIQLIIDGNSGNKSFYYTHHFEYVDSPSTTSSTTYKVRFKANSGTTFYSQNGNKTASLILMELAGWLQ